MRSESLSRFAHLSRSEKRALVEAAFYVGTFRIVEKLIPFRWIAKALKKAGPRRAVPAPEQLKTARRIGWAVAAVSRTRTFKAVCLGQAIAAHLMLAKRGIPSTFNLGVAYEDSKMIAHAWTVAKFSDTDDLIVTGAIGHERFRIVSTIESTT